MTHARPRSPRQAWTALVAVCGIVVAVFLVFCIVYGTTVHHRIFDRPERYVDKARYQLRQRPPDAAGALATLQRGIDFYVPETDAPFRVLHDALAALGDERAAKLALERGAFQQRLRVRAAAGPPRAAQLAELAQRCRDLFEYTPADADRLAAPFDTVWSLFVEAIASDPALRRELLGLSRFQALVTLDLAGWPVSPEGRVGRTGVTIPESLVVASAGLHVGRTAFLGLGSRGQSFRRRGLVVVSADPRSLGVRYMDTLDVFGGQHTTEDVLVTLRFEVDPGDLAILLVCDEASTGLDQDALFAELGKSFGLSILARDRRGRTYLNMQESFAAVCVRKAARGTGLSAHTRAGDWPAGVVILPPRR